MATLTTATINFSLPSGLCIYRGSDWNMPIGVSDDDGNAVDLTGLTASCVIKHCSQDSDPIVNPEVIIAEPLSGIFRLHLDADDTYKLETLGETWRDASTYQYEVDFKNEDGDIMRALQGYIDVSPTMQNQE